MNEESVAQMQATPGIGRPKIVVVIGSTRFKQFHLGVQQRETLKGSIVLTVGFFHHVDNVPITEADKHALDQLGKRKIEMADEVYVVNVHGYVGETTRMLVDHARELGKLIRWMEDPTE